MKEFVTKRIKSLQPSGIRKFFDLAQGMKGVISLGVGEPDFVTPWGIRDYAIRSIRKGETQYTANRGLIELRENIQKYLKTRFNVETSPSQTIVTVGASEGIDLVLRAICEEGVEVLVPEPCYVSYFPCVEMSGGKAVGIPCDLKDNFIITPENLEKVITPQTKAIILAYPNNPTGTIMTEEQIRALVPIILQHDLLVISDEIYAELTYGGKHFSVASIPELKDRVVLISGFSKSFAMTGWRIGFICSPKEIDEAIYKIHQYTIMCAPRMAQHAALHALSEGFADDFAVVEEMRVEYDKRRRFLVEEFNKLGLTCFEPKGAFYVFPSVKATGLTGDEFASELLNAQKVAVVPGSAFGSTSKYHIRCSYATSMAQLKEAIERIKQFLSDRDLMK